MQTHRERFKDSWSACDRLAVIDEFLGDAVPGEASVFDEDPISEDPSDHGKIDDAEFLSKEVGSTDLVGVALEILYPFVEGGALKVGIASMEDTEVTRDDELVDVVNPDPSLSGLVRVSRS